MSIAQSYTSEIRRELRRFATWEPGLPMRLGDFGILTGSLFSRVASLKDIGVAFDRRKSQAGKRVLYSSKGGVEMEVGAGASADVGPVAGAKAALKITFAREHAVLLNAAGVSYESVGDNLALQRKLLELLQEGDWDPRHSVVTEIMHSRSTTVAVSSGIGASLLLEAEGDVPTVDLADFEAKLGVRSERNIGYRAITADGMTPLLGLSRIRPSGAFWWRRTELRRELGFAGEAGDPVLETIPRGFQVTLDENLDTLIDASHATGTPVEEAFEWTDLQPPERPGDS